MFIKGPAFADCRRHFLQKKIRQHPTCRQKPITDRNSFVSELSKTPLSSFSFFFVRFDTSSRKPFFSRSLSEPSAEVRQRQSAGGPSTPKKKRKARKAFTKDFHNNGVQKPSTVFVLLCACDAFSVSPFTRNLCFGFAVTLCDNAR